MNRKAFTLIELLIVVTIIGILAVALVPRIIGGSAAARDARRQTDLQTISTGLEYYLSEYSTLATINGATALTAGQSFCSNSADFATSVSSFLKSVPSDPLSSNINSSTCTGSYSIIVLADSTGAITRYAVVAKLESPKSGAENVYTAASTATTYSAFSTALVDFTTGTTGYFIIF